MPVRNAEARWQGNLKDGKGMMKLGSGAFEGAYTFASRFEEGKGTNPEELIGAAHAGCFSMAMAFGLEKSGYHPQQVQTKAKVHLERHAEGFKITKVELYTEADVPGIAPDVFKELAEGAKRGCPVSQALAGIEIMLEAKLINS